MNIAARARSFLRSSESEYRANLAGLNMFFGAVLGFVVTGIERLEGFQFGLMLAVCSAIVMCILYVSESGNRWVWAGCAALFIWALPSFVPDGVAVPPKLQPTFAVWLILTIFIQLTPRQASERPAPPGDPDQARATTLSGKSLPNTR